jgi:hypothetical protein
VAPPASLRCKLVLPTRDATWVREVDLPFPPHPSLGIWLDAYDMVKVKSVIVGDAGFDVTCIVEPETAEDATDAKLEALGFEVAPYP